MLYRFLNPFPGIVSSQYNLVKNNEILLQKKWTQWFRYEFCKAAVNVILHILNKALSGVAQSVKLDD